MIKLVRTNAKAEGFRVVDLPRFDVVVDGEVVGEVWCSLVRESRHYSSGSVRSWNTRVGSRREYGFASKASARDRAVAVWLSSSPAA
jgi:hypothetical protein